MERTNRVVYNSIALHEGMRMKETTFDTLVEDCLGKIRAHASDKVGLQISPAILNFLAERANHEIVPQIVGATNPMVKRLLISSEGLGRK